MRLIEEVYRLTRALPREERYGLSAQLRRAAVGIPSNVAECQQYGFGKTYVRYVAVAVGCEAEVQTQLELLIRLKFMGKDRVAPVLDLASRTGQVLRGLKRSVARSANARRADQ
jgi:four helix bundle protein